MRTQSVFRASIIAAAFGAALSAHAVSIFVSSAGTSTQNGVIGFSASEAVNFQDGGLGALDTLAYTVTYNLNGGDGVGTYTGVGGSFSFDFSYLNSNVTNIGPSVSAPGTWTATGGTGTYAGGVGSGTLTINEFAVTSPFRSGTLFSGDIQAVPEPASIAALGVGALGLLRRRRRA